MIAEPNLAEFNKAVQEYWEKPTTVSIIDKNLHELEIETVLRHLEPNDRLADIGCGDGSATVRYAARVKSVTAFERSGTLRAKAADNAARAEARNLTLRPGDVMDLSGVAEQFDAVVTQRLLINLASWDDQAAALENIRRILRPGGRLIMVENTNQAFQAMNDVRHGVGLAPVPQHWHNRFFDHDQLVGFMDGKFQLLRHYDFGLYYLLTRVYVPMFASFQGWGANAVKDPIFDKADAAARALFELMGDRVKIDGGKAFGPIQVFVWRREA